MKKITLLSAAVLACCILHTACCFSQGTAINTNGATADPSALLDLSSTTKGFVLPRMTTVQRNAIASPTQSLQIFNTDVNCLQIYINSVWQNIYCDLGCSAAPAMPGSITGNATPCQNESGVAYSTAQVAGATYYNWSVPAGATIAAGQGTTAIIVNFGTNSGSITVTSSNGCGISAPQSLTITLSTAPAQPSAISGNNAPCVGATGLTYSVTNVAGVTYNWTLPSGGAPLWTQTGGGTTNSITATAGSASGDITVTPSNACGSGTAQTLAVAPDAAPSAPAATSATNITSVSFFANWNASSGAANYYLDVATDNGFTGILTNYNNLDVGGVVTYSVTGLICNTLYYYRVRSANSCGTSGNSDTINLNTSVCPGCFVIGGTGSDVGSSVINTSDGGYAIAGYTNVASSLLYFVKADGTGNIMWTKNIGGTVSDNGCSIIQTSDGGYAISGSTNSFGAGNSDFYVVKLDGSGNLSWTKTFGGWANEIGYAIIQTSDGGYAVAGYTNSFGAGGFDMYITKLDGSGNLTWEKTVGGSVDEIAYSIIQTSDGGYVMLGNTSSFGGGNNDFYLVKLDGSGTLQWTKTVGGSSGEIGKTIIKTSDGGYTASGYTSSFGAGNNDVYVMKFDGSWNLSWTKTIGGTLNDYGTSIIQSSDGGYAISGSTNSFGAGGSDMYIVKLDGSGNLLWTNTMGGAGTDAAKAILTRNDEFVVVGYTASFGAGGYDIYIALSDANGNSCCFVSQTSSVGSGGSVSSGGTLSTPTSSVSSGGTVGSGGIKTIICN